MISSSDFEFLDARNLIFVHSLSYAPYTNYGSLINNSLKVSVNEGPK